MKKMALAALAVLAAATCAVAADPGVSIPVYNSDMALVKDVRLLDIEAGVHELRFTDVAQRIDPTSVHFKILEGSEALVWEQNYRFDLASSSKIPVAILMAPTTKMTTTRTKMMTRTADEVAMAAASRGLSAPCTWCGYNGSGYWQRGSHKPDCPWYQIGGCVDGLAEAKRGAAG